MTKSGTGCRRRSRSPRSGIDRRRFQTPSFRCFETRNDPFEGRTVYDSRFELSFAGAKCFELRTSRRSIRERSSADPHHEQVRDAAAIQMTNCPNPERSTFRVSKRSVRISNYPLSEWSAVQFRRAAGAGAGKAEPRAAKAELDGPERPRPFRPPDMKFMAGTRPAPMSVLNPAGTTPTCPTCPSRRP